MPVFFPQIRSTNQTVPRGPLVPRVAVFTLYSVEQCMTIVYFAQRTKQSNTNQEFALLPPLLEEWCPATTQFMKNNLSSNLWDLRRVGGGRLQIASCWKQISSGKTHHIFVFLAKVIEQRQTHLILMWTVSSSYSTPSSFLLSRLHKFPIFYLQKCSIQRLPSSMTQLGSRCLRQTDSTHATLLQHHTCAV